MNITPLEIRQKQFEKSFRGYDKDEVLAFLNSLSIEWEKVNEQNKELKYKLEAAENEVKKLREVENSLFKTLKTAEDTGASMVEQATKTAELHMRETEMRADGLMNEAKSRAKSIIEDAENKAKMIVDDMEDEITQLEQVFRSLKGNKEAMVSDLRMLAEDMLSKIQRHEEFPQEIKTHLKKAKDLTREVNDVKKVVDVNQIMEEHDQKEAEQSIDEMVDDQTDAAIEELGAEEKSDNKASKKSVVAESSSLDKNDMKPLEEPKNEQDEHPKEVAKKKATDDETGDTEEAETKDKNSFFDKFD